MKKSKKSTAFLFLLPFLMFFILFWLVPFFYGVFMSLHKYSLINGNQGFVGLENYLKILLPGSMHNKNFFVGLKNTITFVLMSTPFLVFGSLALALLIDALPEKCKPVFRTIYFASYAVSVTAVSAIFIWLLRGNGGYLNNMLLNMSIISQPIPWLESREFAWISITIATLWWTIGYNMMLFINALNEIDTSVYEAAALDGAGFWKRLKDIILPSIKHVFFFVLMTTIIASFNLFGQSRLMTGGGPGQSTKPIIMIINDTIIGQNNLGIGSAMTVLLGIIIVLCSVAQYYMTRAKDEINS